MKIIDKNKDERSSHVPSGQPNKCSNQRDFYGNLQVNHVDTTTMFDLQVNVSDLNKSQPRYVTDYAFGVTDVYFHIVKKSLTGTEVITTFPIKEDVESKNPLESVLYNKTMDNPSSNGELENGQRLCLRMEVLGGGHADFWNKLTGSTQLVQYPKTSMSKELCYWYDNAPPQHCLEHSSCGTEPLDTSSRILTSRDFTVTFTGWDDPSPVPGDPKFASGIHTYVVNMYEVKESGSGFLDIGRTPVIPEIENNNLTQINISIPSNVSNPAMYVIVLDVTDVANNVRQARRFVMFDNSSTVKARDDKILYSTTASQKTNHKWQTNLGQICYSWTDKYYNDKFHTLNLLQPIREYPHGLISGVYEQTTGILPVSGTENIHGITRFYYTLKRDGMVINKADVPDFTSQKLCVSPKLTDGKTYRLDLVAEDVVTHTYTDSLVTYIDSSEPEILDIWLEKDGYERLFVHNSIDLSKMILTFEASDIHSGIYSVDWSLGTTFGGNDIGQGSIGVQRLGPNITCPDAVLTCYCPSVGVCSFNNFTLHLNSLVHNHTHKGNHNRQYHFTITVTNIAQLVSVEHLEILADDSPPAPGVVMEGTIGSPDIDYTGDEIITVNWAGFIDHESGIKLYKVGLSTECLDIAEFGRSNDNITNNGTSILETTLKSVRLSLPEDGKFYVTVVAYNNAMEPSKPVCSDGIVLDRTKPKLVNFTLQSATMRETVLCSDGSAWFITANLTKHELRNIECSEKCQNSTTNDFVSSLPRDIPDMKHDLTPTCNISALHGTIYLPIDLINLKWDIIEGESQTHEAFFGIGSTKDCGSSPDVIGYQKTNHKYFYKKRHTGLSNGDEFYIFIRVTNSAGLGTSAVIGPVLLDESPPVCPNTLLPNIHDDTLVINWTIGEFRDNDQHEDISSFNYRIGRDGKLVSGFILLPNTGCNGSKCFNIDVSDIQAYDIHAGCEFYIEVYAFNNAGYYCTVDTEPFYLPSILPPGHGIVFDITPGNISPHKSYDDVDIALASSHVCVTWEGFEHHGGVSYEFGVGQSPGTDDVVSFHQISNTSVHCDTATNLTKYTQYFSTVRASSTGGKRVGISDGLIMVNEDDIDSSILQVYDGQGCSGRAHILKETVFSTKELAFIPADKKFHIGHTYTFIANASVSILSEEAIIYTQRQIKQLYYTAFTPMVRSPRFNVSSNDDKNYHVRLYVADCVIDHDIMFASKRVSVYWDNDDFHQYVSHYEVELRVVSRDNASQTDLVTLAYGKTSGNTAAYSFNDVSLRSGRYIISVRPCIREMCLKWTSSDGFVVTDATYDEFSVEANLHKTGDACSSVSLTISDIECPSGIDQGCDVIARWGIFKDNTATLQVTPWIAHQISENQTENFMISQCIKIPLYPHQTLFTCVELYCPLGTSGLQCVPLTVSEDPNSFDKTALYEVDSDSDVVREIRNFIHASNLGKRLASLHEAELDFSAKPVRVGGIILGLEDRQVTWYLLKDKRNQSFTCDDNPLCVTVHQTVGGFCPFQGIVLENDIIHYICAEIESYTTPNGQILPAFQTCGDGFVFDENPPEKGDVIIISQNGYITNNRHMLVHWDGFKDFHGYKDLGYPDSISRYEYSIGSNPHGEDVVARKTIGHSNSVKIISPNLHPGSTYYATVTAFDHVGHSSTVVSPGVLYDDTPPVRGSLHVGTYLMSKDFIESEVHVHWTGFDDDDSGIDRIQVGIGSTKSETDIVSFRNFSGKCAIFTDLSHYHDGHDYYAIILVTNKAGLSVLSASESFVIDKSPPTKGTVQDGVDVQSPDIDFQANTTHAGCHWSGFSDPHSGLLYYTAGLGTQPSEDDVRTMTSTGTQTVIRWQHTLVPGAQYFCTVQACNGAGLCTSVSSNGFTTDTSPPVPGVVHVGIDGHHSRYWPHPDTIQAQWFGFSDVESGIRRYEVCIRSIDNEICDILPFTNFLLADYMTIPVTLPLDKTLCVIVRAENHLGMSTESVSDSFVVDPTPPILVTKPIIHTEEGYTSLNNLYQFDPSVLKLSWKFQDSESPIVKHIVSITTHHEGHTPVENIHLTNINELRMSLPNKDWLKPGDTYIARVTACNEAGLCTSEKSNSLPIDPTPPHLGGITEPMTWYSITESNITVSAINITLSGFIDVESGVKLYHVTVSKTYSGSELSDGVISFTPSGSGIETIQVLLNDTIDAGQLLIITVWAENFAGLQSEDGKVTVTAVSSSPTNKHGELEILKHSCDVHYCNKDCTCAVVGQKCHDVDVPTECERDNTSSSISLYIDVIHGSVNTLISASSACISARWTINGSDVEDIKRFEWTIGQNDMPVGTGIFDPLYENLWYDIGKQTSIVHCLRGERYLKHGASYVVYVRVWMSASEFIVFTSSPIEIDNTPPSVRKGSYIRENGRGSCDRDLDITTTLDSLTACWGKVFSDHQSGIYSFLVSLGTIPGADDIITIDDVGLNTSMSWSDLTLSPGTKYYVTVTATNQVGLHITLVSDGVLVDQENPYTGEVFNTAKFYNSHSQNYQDVGVSFRGFADRHSAIKTFLVAFDRSGNGSQELLKFERIGIQNTHRYTNMNLTDGHWYRFAVKALDAAGFESETIFSPQFMYDSSTPTGFAPCEYRNLFNETLESENGTFVWTKPLVNNTHPSVYRVHLVFTEIEDGELVEISFEDQRHMYPIQSNMFDANEVHASFLSSPLFNDDRNIVVQMDKLDTNVNVQLLIDVSDNITLTNNTDNSVIVRQVSPSELHVTVNVLDEESGIKNIFVGAGSTRGGFQIHPLVIVPWSSTLFTEALHGQEVHITAIAENHAGDRSHFHASPVIVDHTPPQISNTKMTINYKQISEQTLTKVTLTWEVTDAESKITQCACAIVDDDNIPIYDGIDVSLRQFVTPSIPLTHGTMISAHVTCYNDANMKQVTTVGPELISYLPPDVKEGEISFVTTAETSAGIPVTCPSSPLMFSWEGIDDSFGIEGYSYRIIQGDRVTKDWEDTEMRTSVSVEDISLTDNRLYTVEVMASNYAGVYSEAINASILVLGHAPILTGKYPRITRTGKTLDVSWNDVFSVRPELQPSYTVTLGSEKGFTDIASHKHLQDQRNVFDVSYTGNEVFTIITCTYITGTSDVFRGRVTVS
ncbi:uncharacterized protein [Argopecten irradians]|uniref:uncharacterized protein isoform X3 n=1 Tax=Argopecten irradians TaxID=31199 RepID=UPI00371122A2